MLKHNIILLKRGFHLKQASEELRTGFRIQLIILNGVIALISIKTFYYTRKFLLENYVLV